MFTGQIPIYAALDTCEGKMVSGEVSSSMQEIISIIGLLLVSFRPSGAYTIYRYTKNITLHAVELTTADRADHITIRIFVLLKLRSSN